MTFLKSLVWLDLGTKNFVVRSLFGCWGASRQVFVCKRERETFPRSLFTLERRSQPTRGVRNPFIPALGHNTKNKTVRFLMLDTSCAFIFLRHPHLTIRDHRHCWCCGLDATLRQIECSVFYPCLHLWYTLLFILLWLGPTWAYILCLISLLVDLSFVSHFVCLLSSAAIFLFIGSLCRIFVFSFEILFVFLYSFLCAHFYFTIFTQPLRSGRIWHEVNFLSGV